MHTYTHTNTHMFVKSSQHLADTLVVIYSEIFGIGRGTSTCMETKITIKGDSEISTSRFIWSHFSLGKLSDEMFHIHS